MKKSLLALALLSIFTFHLSPLSALRAQDEVNFEFSDGIEGPLKQRMEQNVSRLLTAINRAQSTGKDINYSGIEIDGLASQSIGMMWNNVHMRVVDDDIVEHCLRICASNGNVINYQARNIAVEMHPLDDSYSGDRNQEVEITFGRDGRITDFNITMGAQQYLRIIREGERLNDADRRMQIVAWVNQFRNAYVQKDIQFMENVFSDDALIVTGKVLKRTTSDVKPPIQYSTMGKEQYLRNLRRVFKNNSYINVKFDDIEIMRHGSKPNYYGVTLKQGWFTKNYSDEGIVFLVWDFSDELNPKIMVRTWQPMEVEEDDIFTLKSFKLN